MSREMVEQIADAILYEGYILYPYRPSSIKNRQRWNFGGLCPRSYSEAQQGSERWRNQTECLVIADAGTSIRVKIRFLHLVNRQPAQLKNPVLDVAECPESAFGLVDSLEIGGRLFQNWQEAIEREIELPAFALAEHAAGPQSFHFQLPSSRSRESLPGADGRIIAALIRTQNALEIEVQIEAEYIQESLFRIRLQTINLTPFPATPTASREEAMMYSLVSCHAILHVQNGEFVSLLDPPASYADAASACENIGTYPVLAGIEGNHSAILSSPVILYDYPKIAPESAGDLFDGTEIDEILTLRIMALTDQEKLEMRQCDDRARRILERIEADPQHLANLHGAIRSIDRVESNQNAPESNASENSNEWDGAMQDWNPLEEKPKLEVVRVRGVELRCGDRVRLRPSKKADILDLALTGQIAVIESIEQDYDERVHLAVILDDDPGRDLGELRQPGHRFFFGPEEVEPVVSPSAAICQPQEGNL